jgi:ABC-2 type transport system ATP-binding protein
VSDRIILKVSALKKTYRKPFSGKKVEAVRGVSFEVVAGEIFGFLGPNGAGKTTTIKMLTGLIRPTSGEAWLFGERAPSADAMGRVGFLPENPYVYPYLTPREFVTLAGELNGVRGATLRSKVASVIERVGVAYAIDRPVRALSKGMLQRVGFAAALVHDPELLVLDEPMSGLDPVGRKEVRDIIVEERRAGRTVFFSSHILSDVELLCDRVCILRKGEVVVQGALRELLRSDVRRSELVLADVSEALEAELTAMGLAVRSLGRVPGRADREQTPQAEEATGARAGGLVSLEVEGEAAVRLVLERALSAGARVESVLPKRETLEDVFVRKAL